MTTAVSYPRPVTVRIPTQPDTPDTTASSAPATAVADTAVTTAASGTPAAAPGTPGPAAAPAAVGDGLGVYTVTVFMNTAPHSFDGYQPHHPLAVAARPDGTPLVLVFRASDRICSHEAAAEAAFTVGNRQGPDDTGQTWPADIRSVSVGDVVKVTGPDHWIIHLCVANLGCTPVAEPAYLTPLAGSRVTSRP
ncbi:hypothetical protein ABZS59_36150 [Streptomyces flaveolus]|uniref:hypothetical protein n=1 Tax=Streptomyces flaveolus TaxID=67297 RepID=UPI0033A17186